MGFDKLGAELAGETVLNRSLLAFQKNPKIFEIIVVTSVDKFEVLLETADSLGITKFAGAVEGGAERHFSVNAGLEKVDPRCDFIAVHDAARPLVTPEAISLCAAAATKVGGASLAHRVADTLKRADQNGEVCESVSRDDLWAMETPQIFRADWLREAYQFVFDSCGAVTDEVSALEAIGRPVQLVENKKPNFKITVPADLAVAEALLRPAASRGKRRRSKPSPRGRRKSS